MPEVQQTGTWRIEIVRGDGVHLPLEGFPNRGEPILQMDFPTEEAARQWGRKHITNPEVDWTAVRS